MTVEPFTVAVPRAVLDELRARLAATRWPRLVDGSGWEDGTSPAWLRGLVAYWRDTHGWPSTFYELLPLVPLLTDPPDPADAFDVVIPSLPGYGFSAAMTTPARTAATSARSSATDWVTSSRSTSAGSMSRWWPSRTSARAPLL